MNEINKNFSKFTKEYFKLFIKTIQMKNILDFYLKTF
jgi:hypothetical protein